MPNKYNRNYMMIGAAVVTGILGVLSVFSRNRETVREWAQDARNIASRFSEKDQMINKRKLLGGIAGGLIGAGAALLFAPKAGNDLIYDISHLFSKELKSLRKSVSKKAIVQKSKKLMKVAKKKMVGEPQKKVKTAARSRKNSIPNKHPHVPHIGEASRAVS